MSSAASELTKILKAFGIDAYVIDAGDVEDPDPDQPQ